MPLAVLRDVPEPVLDERARQLRSCIHLAEENFPRERMAQPGDSFSQLGLPVALNARNPQDFSFLNLKRDVPDDLDAPVVAHGKPFNAQSRFFRMGFPLWHGQDHLSPDHHRCQLAAGDLLRGDCADHFPGSHDRDPV